MPNPGRAIERMAAQSNLTVPTVRFWAETRGDMLGIRRDAAGEWHFSPEAAAFLRQLGEHASAMRPDVSGEQRPRGPGAEESGTPHLEALREALAALENRHDELAACTADLSDEMKQMQMLLSRVLELLAPPQPPGQRPRVVRPWRPRRL